MSLGKDIILFSTGDWDNPTWTNKQHMAVLFAENGYRVLYVDSLGLRQPGLRGKDVRRILNRLKKALPFPRQVRPNIWRISPLVLPFHGGSAVRTCNAFFLRATILWHMRLMNMRKPLILTYNPVIAPLCAALPHSHIIYHCVDDLRASPHIDPHVITLGEKMLSEVADLCFTTAPELQKRMQSLFSRTVYEPNVCDYKMFRTARDKNLTEPADMAAIPHPRALFVGALSEYKVDFKLMEAVARRMPHVHWVLIGPEGEGQPDSRRAPHLPNIHMLGHRPYAGLPSYMAHAQVAVLPAMHNAYTASMFPMKFFEFLAAGLPLVSTRLPALHAFENLCWLADGEENFCASLRDVLDGKRKDAKAIDAACRYHSWSARFERMQTALRELDGSAPAQNVQNSFASKERV